MEPETDPNALNFWLGGAERTLCCLWAHRLGLRLADVASLSPFFLLTHSHCCLLSLSLFSLTHSLSVLSALTFSLPLSLPPSFPLPHSLSPPLLPLYSPTLFPPPSFPLSLSLLPVLASAPAGGGAGFPGIVEQLFLLCFLPLAQSLASWLLRCRITGAGKTSGCPSAQHAGVYGWSMCCHKYVFMIWDRSFPSAEMSRHCRVGRDPSVGKVNCMNGKAFRRA